ncbi:MAG: right-handed parallel beta-helix repeat-containing protein [Ruminococcus sp.]|nr:right-handed parallel beta-helix repeat-containing protein [Ruminococcus sp.]
MKKYICKFITALICAVAVMPVTAVCSANIKGDINGDEEFNIADLVLFQKWLLAVPDSKIANWKSADFCEDEILDVFDFCIMRQELITAENNKSIIVSNTDELYNAVKNARAGDIIKVASGIYDVSSETISSEADGTENAPIILTALDKNSPPVLTGSTTEHGYILHILGDNWIIDSLICQNSQKGIVLDNSDNTIIQNCELHTLGAEAIAVRDGSSYCTIKSCYIHDTGLVSPGYGEGVYIGSAKSNNNFDHYCDHNKVVGCTFKNVAAEHIDVKEYTTDTEISDCIFYGDGMTGENFAGSFIDLKGNECYVHDNTGYRNGNSKIVAAFEIHEQVEGWGYHHIFENNTLYMNQPYGAENTNRRMYVVDGWFSDFSVKNNQVDYGNGLVPADSQEYYNSDNVTYLN